MTMADRIGVMDARPFGPGRHPRAISMRRRSRAGSLSFVGDINLFDGRVVCVTRTARHDGLDPGSGTLAVSELSRRR